MSWPQTDPTFDEKYVTCWAHGCDKRGFHTIQNPSSKMKYTVCSVHKRLHEQGHSFRMKGTGYDPSK